LNWAKNWVRYGDLPAFPLLLNAVDILPPELQQQGKEFNLFIPFDDATLDSLITKYEWQDRELLGLSLISTFCSSPYIKCEITDRNIRVFCPDLTFVYKWTLCLSCHVYEICWKTKGIPVITDLDYTTLFPRLYSFICSDCKSSYSPCSCRTHIGDFKKYGLALEGEYDGLLSMSNLLYKVLSLQLKISKFELRYRKLDDYSEIGDNLSSLLDVFPDTDREACSLSKTQNNRRNKIMSDNGKICKTREFLDGSDIVIINNLYEHITSVLKKPSFDFPSDTGYVVLKKDGKLVASKKIEEGQEFTYVPITQCKTFSNPRVLVGTVHGSVLKKALPFCGFGGFVQWGTEAKAN